MRRVLAVRLSGGPVSTLGQLWPRLGRSGRRWARWVSRRRRLTCRGLPSVRLVCRGGARSM